MKAHIRQVTCLSALAAAAVACGGASALAAQSPISLRQVDAPIATTTESLGLILGASRLRDGRLLVNDGGHRRLLLFDSLLKNVVIVADTLGSTGLKYGGSPSSMIAWLGDTISLLDRGSRAFIVIDPNGRQARIAVRT